MTMDIVHPRRRFRLPLDFGEARKPRLLADVLADVAILLATSPDAARAIADLLPEKDDLR
jgi:hypothetical protein